MSDINRRRFLDETRKATLGLAGGATILANPGSVRGTPANDRLVLAMIGVGGNRGNPLAMGFLDRGDCEISYICDVNRQILPGRVEEYAARQGGKRPKSTQDFREMLGDTSIDAVVIATPPHWHALATILCCRAGKDVYCEKPQSHDCWEGRQAVNAARKYDRIVQIGTQNRSAPYNWAAKRYLEEGKLGRVQLCRVFEQCLVPDFKWGAGADPRRRSTGTCGTARLRHASMIRRFIRNGGNSGITLAVTCLTRGFINSIWPAGWWASITPQAFTARAGVSSHGATRKRPILS